MCGIVGYFSVDNYKDEIQTKLDLINSRGPDSRGEVFFNKEDLSVGFGHVRLSILDLSAKGAQPFYSKCGKYCMVYNGEVYNFKQLREKLPNIVFESNSDSEVIIELFAAFGVEAFNMLEGMFALAIYNIETGKCIIARDQLGIKPVYYNVDGGKIAFASELKALFAFKDVVKKPDTKCLTEFFLNGYLYEPDTGFENVYKVKPGQYIELEKNGSELQVSKTQYWTPTHKPNTKKSLDQIVGDAVNSHTVSDVPVGLFYSGGIDSTVILTELNDAISPFIVARNEDSYKESGFVDDSYYADEIAKELKIKLNKIQLDSELKDGDLFTQIEQMCEGLEEPIADFTYISSEILSKKVKEEGYTVMLSGMGADEIFGGYPRYNMVKYEKLYRFFAPIFSATLGKQKKFAKKINRFKSFLSEKEFEMKYTSLIGSFSKDEVKELLGKEENVGNYLKKLKSITSEVANYSPMKKAMYLDWLGFLSHNFIVADKSSMKHSIEIRVPLATKEMYEVVFKGGVKLMTFLRTKLTLRNMLYKVISKKLVDRKKTGFNPPMDDLVRNLGKSKCLSFMEENNLFQFCNRAFIENLLNEHFAEEKNNTFRIFQLLYISLWLKKSYS